MSNGTGSANNNTLDSFSMLKLHSDNYYSAALGLAVGLIQNCEYAYLLHSRLVCPDLSEIIQVCR